MKIDNMQSHIPTGAPVFCIGVRGEIKFGLATTVGSPHSDQKWRAVLDKNCPFSGGLIEATEANYHHLVALFGAESVPELPLNIKPGDYVTGASTDLEGISDYNYIVVDNGTELVIFDDSGDMLPIIEQIQMGYFKILKR